ncbi:hypothetical protein G5B30_09535 [Sphingobacterium sp. SGG-5]|uniref:M60 family metallopeptidase n=1 Tax=Sphingobacterium sp. SGG-5 TaxID=2710881 RepID=UPI0013E9B1F1|nr:M60 family metallopeptidase [Sphingobacterium sp. SGG-5]NGM62155.1 hypothetical protein [Sphingobacterium sp. SGG-5]
MKGIKNITWMALGLVIMMVSCSKEYGYNFENGYNSGEYEDTVDVDIDTDPFKIDYSKYTQARLFPGLIAEDEPRLEEFLVQIDLDYEEISSRDLRISVAPGAWQSTGVYAPAGELIVIDVPMGVYGLTAQISPHVATSTDGIDFPRRDAVIFNRQTLFPGKNYMRNLYGGLIYIIPARPLGRIIDLYFTGVAKAPSFKLNGPGATTNEEWQAMVDNTTVPWFELEGDRIVFTMETEKLKNNPIPDPTELMETWDRAIREGYWDWTGMTEGNPDIRHRAPFNKWRIVHDVLFRPGVAQVSGYPVRAGNTENYFRQATTVDAVKNSNWGTYHELGHNMQMGSTWSFAGNGEVTNNVFHFGVSWLVFGQQSYKIAEVWHKAVPYIAETKSKDGANAMNWAALDLSDNKYKSQAHDIRLMMWAQILEKYGYDFWTYIYKRGREARFTSANDQSKVDFFYEALSEFTETDMEPYLNQWGLYVSAVSKRYVSETKGFPLLDRQVWNFNPVTRTGGDELYLPEINKEGWAVITTSSQKSYPAIQLIDDNASTIWHSCYGDCGNPGNGSIPPSSDDVTWDITIDLGSAKSLNGFVLNQRNTDHLKNSPTKITLYVSADGVNYTELGEYPLSVSPEKQAIYFESNREAKSFRYAKFIIKRIDLYGFGLGEKNTALAELGFFALN